MRTSKNVRHFIHIEDGLVSVEWIALMAGLVVAGVAVAFIVMQNSSQEGGQAGSIVQPSAGVFGANVDKLKESQTPPPP